MKAYGFSRRERLTGKREFEAVYKAGRRIRNNRFLHACFFIKPGSTVRLGLSVSKKVGKAVIRNQVKRKLREVFRNNKGAVKKGGDIVLIARPGIKDCTFRDLEEIFLSFWYRNESKSFK